MASFNRLQENLASLERELVTFCSLIKREREDIIKLDLEGLATRQTELEAVIAHFEPLNTAVAAMVGELCQQHGIAAPYSITKLLAVTPPAERKPVEQLQKELRRLSQQAENDVSINKVLLKDSLEFSTKSLTVFTNALKAVATPTYGSQGRFIDNVEQPRIICKEI